MNLGRGSSIKSKGAWRSFIMLIFLSGASLALAQDTLKKGDKAPEISGKDHTGKALSLKALCKANKAVIVDFWADWCEPCKKEVPKLNELYEENKGKGLAVVGVNLDKSREKMDAFIEKKKVSFPNVHDPAKAIPPKWGMANMPTSFILDQSCTVQFVRSDKTAAAKIKSETMKLLK